MKMSFVFSRIKENTSEKNYEGRSSVGYSVGLWICTLTGPFPALRTTQSQVPLSFQQHLTRAISFFCFLLILFIEVQFHSNQFKFFSVKDHLFLFCGLVCQA